MAASHDIGIAAPDLQGRRPQAAGLLFVRRCCATISRGSSAPFRCFGSGARHQHRIDPLDRRRRAPRAGRALADADARLPAASRLRPAAPRAGRDSSVGRRLAPRRRRRSGTPRRSGRANRAARRGALRIRNSARSPPGLINRSLREAGFLQVRRRTEARSSTRPHRSLRGRRPSGGPCLCRGQRSGRAGEKARRGSAGVDRVLDDAGKAGSRSTIRAPANSLRSPNRTRGSPIRTGSTTATHRLRRTVEIHRKRATIRWSCFSIRRSAIREWLSAGASLRAGSAFAP